MAGRVRVQTDAPAGKFRTVSTRAYHACALRESGEIECWGGLGVPAALRWSRFGPHSRQGELPV